MCFLLFSNSPTFKIFANDTLGNWNESEEYSYTVVDNEPPEILNVTWTPESPNESESVTVYAEVSDISDVSKVLLYYKSAEVGTWNIVEMVEEYGVYTASIPPYPEFTTIEFKIFANDTFGNWQFSDVFSYTVKDSTPPTLVELYWEPPEPTPEDSVTVFATFSDPSGVDVAILQYRNDSIWYSVEMTRFSEDQFYGVVPPHPASITVHFRIIVNDTVGNALITDEYSYIVVDNDPPEITSVFWNPSQPKANESVTVYAEVSDNVAVDTVILYYSTLPEEEWQSVVMSYSDGYYVAVIPPHSDFTEVWLYVFANDTSGNGATSATYSYTVLDSTPPTFEDIWWTPEEPTPEDNVTVYVAVDDPSGIDIAILLYRTDSEWHEVIMTQVDVGLYLGTIPPYPATIEVTFKVVANDTLGNTAESSEYSYTVIDNTPPTISDISWSPEEPNATESVTVSAIVSDISGVHSVILYYKSLEETDWNFTAMEKVDNYYVGAIPPYPDLTVVVFKIFANDTFGNNITTSEYSYTVKDTTPPTVTDVGWDPPEPTEFDSVIVLATINDPSGVDTAILEYRTDTTWTQVEMGILYGDVYYAEIPPQPALTVVYFRFIVNDTLGNTLISDEYNYTVADASGPIIHSVSWYPETPRSWENVTVYANITDVSGVHVVILFYHSIEEETWHNTEMILSDELYTATIPGYPGETTVEFYIFANDTLGYSSYSTTYSYTVIDTDPPYFESITYYPPSPSFGEPVTVEAIIKDDSAIEEAILSYTDGDTWVNVTMTFTEGVYVEEIPPLEQSSVTFKIYAMDHSGNWAVSNEYTIIYEKGPDEENSTLQVSTDPLFITSLFSLAVLGITSVAIKGKRTP